MFFVFSSSLFLQFSTSSHGLPVEFEIDNKLGIKGPEDVAKIGIAAYNAECRAIVMRYAGEWESVRLKHSFSSSLFARLVSRMQSVVGTRTLSFAREFILPSPSSLRW